MEVAEKISGTWIIARDQVEVESRGEVIDAMVDPCRGRVIFTNDGWIACNIEGTGRGPAHSDAERSRLMQTLVAYIGRNRIEGNQWVTTVQTAWAPEWVGTEQRRTVKIEGDTAQVVTPWRKMPNWAKDQMSRSIIKFVRAH